MHVYGRKQVIFMLLKPIAKWQFLTRHRIGNHLYQRIAKHISLLKCLQNNDSKQKWIQEAVREKLKADEISNIEVGDRFLHLKFDEDLWFEIQEKVESLKAIHTSMSKKQFIEEAIFEKLDREERKSKELLKNMLSDSFEAYENTYK
jgi:hypothetical protein